MSPTSPLYLRTTPLSSNHLIDPMQALNDPLLLCQSLLQCPSISIKNHTWCFLIPSSSLHIFLKLLFHLNPSLSFFPFHTRSKRTASQWSNPNQVFVKPFNSS
ncbi:hypothetical protein RJT34_20244 [Clitoria ternatea]|uniref:Uncharacterized protein n=1 Tax=Clitoria ternatea TaxID=43366 RepID=A0AAN9P5K8_CLITE